MDVLSSRILLRPSNLDRSHRLYRDLLGLTIYREFGLRDDPGLVFFLGQTAGKMRLRPGSAPVACPVGGLTRELTVGQGLTWHRHYREAGQGANWLVPQLREARRARGRCGCSPRRG